MKSRPKLNRLVRPGLALVLGLACASTLPAQVAVTSAPTPAQLAKYDKNKDGKLDAAELAAMQADEAKAAQAVAPKPEASEDAVQLSPFEVKAEDNGYMATNTMSGTRINSKLEDLGASITVVTKQQMMDTAALDINDIFLYEANTEGSDQFTDAITESQGRVQDLSQLNPNQSNRVRGIGGGDFGGGNSANLTTNGFATNGRIPINTYNLDSVEISRGPNSSLAGLGNAGGTVNLNQARGNLSRESSQFGFRVDSWDGRRANIDLNRPILKNKLAVHVSAVYEAKGFTRKPSEDIQKRQFVAFTYKPFQNTTLRGSFEAYRDSRRTPNSVTPRDMVTEWMAFGSPTWDPTTQTVHYADGRSIVAGNNDALLPDQLRLDTTQYSRPSMYIDNNQMVLWTPNRLSSNTTINGGLGTGGAQRILGSYTKLIVNRNTLYPLYTAPGISNKALYDWDNVNFAATNWNRDKAETYDFSIDQQFFHTRTQDLFGQAAWHIEDSDNYNRNLITETAFLYVDVNEKLLDGRVNPFFKRPYVTVWEPTINDRPEYNDNFRGSMVYRLDFTHNEGRWYRWLGSHTLQGYYETSRKTNHNSNFRESVADNHAWMNPANRGSGSATARVSYKYYVGDNQGYNSEIAPPRSGNIRGVYNFYYPLNPQGGVGNQNWVSEPADFEEIMVATSKTRTEVHTRGTSLQSSLLNDSVVTTIGLRKDEQRSRSTPGASVDSTTGYITTTNLNRWNAWGYREGDTKTYQFVVRPFRSLKFINNAAENGSAPVRFTSNFVRSLNFFYNTADSFKPANPALNLFGDLLPNPNGKTLEKGVSFNLFDSRLNARLTWYTTKQKDTRVSGGGSTAVGRIQSLENSNVSYSLDDWAYLRATEKLGPTATADQIVAEQYKIMQLPLNFFDQFQGFSTSDINDQKSQGMEWEMTYRPTNAWNIKFTGAKNETIDESLSKYTQQYIDMRMPVWTTLTDPATGLKWWDSTGASAWYNGQIATAQRLARANVGKPRTQIKKWSWALIANYTIPEGRFKNVKVGTSIRWQDKSTIGFLGAAPEPLSPTDPTPVIRNLDPDKPVYDPARASYDFLAAYQFRMFRGKVRANVQLNVRDAFAHKGLRAIGVNPDGQPYNFRILAGPQWILSSTFDL
jgi:hypothetical protein